MNDLLNYISKFGLSFTTTFLYDTVSGLSNSKAITDATTLAFSFATVDILVNNLFKGWNVFNMGSNEQKWLNERILTPLVSALVYDYLYSSYYKEKFVNLSGDNHSKYETWILGFVVSNITNMINNPVMSLLGWHQI